jgi:hypothetical protein
MALPSVDKPFELVSALPATPANRLVDYSDYQVLRPKRICPVLDARGISTACIATKSLVDAEIEM